MNQYLSTSDPISGSLAQCFATIDGRRIRLMEMINLEASIEKSKKQIAILGKTGKGNRATGWSGKGKAKCYFVSSLFRKLMEEYKQTGKDTYFEIQVTNEDPTSSIGRQTVILLGVNLDQAILTKFNAEEEILDEDIDFTFEDFRIPETFKPLEGAQ